MKKLRIIGGNKLEGQVNISGAKNAALPLLASSLLTSEPLKLNNVPKLQDVSTMIELLKLIGVDATWNDEHAITMQAKQIISTKAEYDLVNKMRASILVLGPLLTRCGEAKVSLPGGCAIGVRPVDLHLKGLESLGATIEIKHGYIKAIAPHGLKGNIINFTKNTVTGTENIMMAAVLANGDTTITNAACEPEIVELANCLNGMGAKITGHGTQVINIQGVSSLHSYSHTVISDRIELGTYILSAGITGGKLELKGHDIDKLITSTLAVYKSIGLDFNISDDSITVSTPEKLSPIDITTEPFPGFPTDLQAQVMALLCIADGTSTITENIWENRFMHVSELIRMGADIKLNGSTATIRPIKKFIGADVMATDLRASFSLIMAGLAADGETILNRVYHLDRGYESPETKLSSCGAIIERIM